MTEIYSWMTFLFSCGEDQLGLTAASQVLFIYHFSLHLFVEQRLYILSFTSFFNTFSLRTLFFLVVCIFFFPFPNWLFFIIITIIILPVFIACLCFYTMKCHSHVKYSKIHFCFVY
ncbi:hypothetical protein BCR41DRAFT_63111 [Lobosporangium transversale]|uniref:Uncharacterized protein n=1 Tax=Lobosporangium transversale TaxID=64571 RepID=A0A1Y2GMG1_9FUNG|nr:hypothetical protein BCR41DRAFT_63111 [Lobosporangium transversale]ORZ15435.1 hypothetical protein BCR41DRAFT_63111 [Lobosporangium transversale]|eukprot:XP_021881183.1 hypothetical protein BCR41DRAFT_63111 [Lobosporangium transversale]